LRDRPFSQGHRPLGTRSIDWGAVIAASNRRAPPQCGHMSTSIANTRRNNSGAESPRPM
jgi:hypothetical protein